MAESKKGTLSVNLTNENSAYPSDPGTGKQITGRTLYQWFKVNGDGSLAGFPNVTGPTLSSRPLDGTTYECHVSYEANGASIPQGVAVSNNPAKTVFSIVAEAGQLLNVQTAPMCQRAKNVTKMISVAHPYLSRVMSDLRAS